jgi:microcystin-dependent protein
VLVSLADADTEATSSKTLGFLDQDLANNADGYVITSGLLDNVDTAAATAGQSVWLSSTAGGYVFGSPPAEPAHSVYLGVVMRANGSNGQIVVKVQNGYELDELHDVSAGSPSNGDLLVYNSTTGLWTKAAQSTLTIAQSQVTSLTADLAAKAATTDTRFVPAGTIAMFGSGTAPTGWLLCNGQVTTGYTALAAVVGANVPDLRNRFIVGAGSTYSQNATGGSTSHSHTLSNNGYAKASRRNNAFIYEEVSPVTSWTSVNEVVGTGGSLAVARTTAVGLGGATDNNTTYLPPYYALTYIIKT